MNKTKRWRSIFAGIGLTASALTGAAVVYANLIKKQSLSSLTVNRWIKGQEFKKKTDELTKQREEVYEKLILENRKLIKHPFAFNFKNVEEYLYRGMQVFIWNDQGQSGQPVIFYLHGGGYIWQPNDYQFLAVDRIARQSDAMVVMPVYPKAPEYTFQDAFPPLIHLYQDIVEEYDPDQLHFLGDSAGGGLALALAYVLEEENLPQPINLILLSPWLDLTNSHPDIGKANELEAFFGMDGLNIAARSWAGDEKNRQTVYTSPKLGDPRKLTSSISIFTGSHETFYYDILDFVQQLDQYEISHFLEVGRGQLHVYPFFPTLEGKQAREKIAQIIRDSE